MYKLDLEKAEEPEIKLPTPFGSYKKARELQKSTYFCFTDYARNFDCVDHKILWEKKFIFIFFPFIFIRWRLIILQYCSGFCHTLTWISHGFNHHPKANKFQSKTYHASSLATQEHSPEHQHTGCPKSHQVTLCPKSHQVLRPISKLTTGHSIALQREEIQFDASGHRRKLP